MLDMEKITHREKVTKKRGASSKIEELRQARIQEFEARLSPLFSNIEDVEMTVSERHILVKHDGIFDLVEFEADSAQCLGKDCLERMPDLKDWWDRYFD